VTTVLVDSNVLLDIATEDPTWGAWSANALGEVAETAPVAINPIIYAEVSIRYATIEEVEEVLPASAFRREALPYDAGFLAGKAFLGYRRRGGQRATPLPDFYIGAHAAVSGYVLLTRDASRYRTFFPKVELISP
jgi:predicted nucleic acid-binding protein